MVFIHTQSLFHSMHILMTRRIKQQAKSKLETFEFIRLSGLNGLPTNITTEHLQTKCCTTYVGDKLNAVFIDNMFQWSECHRQRERIAWTQHQRLRVHRRKNPRIGSSVLTSDTT